MSHLEFPQECHSIHPYIQIFILFEVYFCVWFEECSNFILIFITRGTTTLLTVGCWLWTTATTVHVSFHLFSFPAMEEEGSVFSTASSGFNLCSCSVTQSYPTLCDPMDCSTPGFLVFHCLPEFAQAHVH